MSSAWYFCIDAATYHKIKDSNTTKIRYALGGRDSNVPLNEYDIPMKTKELVVSMLESECNRYKPNKLVKYSNKLPEYIDMLLHQMCKNKKKIRIDMIAMKVSIVKKYNYDYQGYTG